MGIRGSDKSATVKDNHDFENKSTDYLAIPICFTIFAPLEPVKPLYNAQTTGRFYITENYRNNV